MKKHPKHNPNADISRELFDLAETYQLTLIKRERVRDRMTNEDDGPQDSLEHLMDEFADTLGELAWRATQIQAASVETLQAKASILLDWVGHDENDITDQLSASVCRDLMNLPAKSAKAQAGKRLRG